MEKTTLDQNITPLYDALKEHIEKRMIPFDVPGHKQGAGNSELLKLFIASTKVDSFSSNEASGFSMQSYFRHKES